MATKGPRVGLKKLKHSKCWWGQRILLMRTIFRMAARPTTSWKTSYAPASHIKREKAALTVDVHRSKTPLLKPHIKVAEHSFGSLWVYVICQMMAREGLQLTSWNKWKIYWQVKNILMKDFDWQVKCDFFVVSMATWTIEYKLKISLLLSLQKNHSLHFPINLHTAYYN